MRGRQALHLRQVDDLGIIAITVNPRRGYGLVEVVCNVRGYAPITCCADADLGSVQSTNEDCVAGEQSQTAGTGVKRYTTPVAERQFAAL